MNNREERLVTFKAHQIIWFVIGLIEALLALRFTLKLIAANPGNPFADFIYGLSGVFLWPFFGLTITPSLNGVVLELHTLIAMLVYLLAGWGLARLVEVLFYKPAELAPVEPYVETVETYVEPAAPPARPVTPAPHTHPQTPVATTTTTRRRTEQA